MTLREKHDRATPAEREAMLIGEVPIVVPEKPTVSVVLACLNEGPDLEATVALLAAGKTRPDEVIVVDDGSREPVAPRLEVFGRYTTVRVLRNEARTGTGRAKSQGVDAATGDLIVTMDAHMRPQWDWLDIVVAAFRKWPYSIMCPWSYGFSGADPAKPIAGFRHAPRLCFRGARFIPHKHGFWDSAWNTKDKTDPPHGAIIGCVLGGCYIFGRRLMEHLGGYNRNHRGWGMEQEWIALRAWIAGFDCRLLNFPMPHHYASEDHPPDRKDAAGTINADGVAAWRNRHFTMASAWQGDWYERVYGPLMREHFLPPELAAALKEDAPAVAAMRKHLNGIRRRSDQDVGFMLGIPHAETPEQYRAFEAIHGRQK